jgi:8-hydroxy-5-deazaflavin:NADPH oxidoreductase
MTTLGIIGSGNIGKAVARLAVKAGIPIVISNSRGPESLAEFVGELGPLATAGTVQQSANAADVVLLSVPLTAHTTIEPSLLEGKTVLDTSNYYPFRDGRVQELDDSQVTTSELIQRHFAAAGIVKAFNNILAHHIPVLASPSGSNSRTVLPVASDNPRAKAEAMNLIDRLGFDALDAGSLSESWRFEPEAAGYTRVYLADPTVPDGAIMEAPAAPVSADKLKSTLQKAVRVQVSERKY